MMRLLTYLVAPFAFAAGLLVAIVAALVATVLSPLRRIWRRST